MIHCSVHSAQVAGWQCAPCGRELCVVCAALTENGVVICASCGMLATPCLAARAQVFPFRRMWPAALGELGRPRGLLQVFVVGTAAHACFTWGKSLWVLGCLLTVAWVLILARRGAVGLGAFAMPTWHDLQVVAAGPLLRAAPFLAPIGLAAMAVSELGLVARPFANPWGWVLGGVALIALPPGLPMAIVEGEGRSTIWPWRLGRGLRLFGGDLRPLQLSVVIAALLGVVSLWLPPVNRELEDTRMLEHLFESWLPRLLAFGALGALGALTGLLVLTRAEQLGHQSTEPDHVPQLDVAPTGRYEPPRDLAAEEAARVRKYAPIVLAQSRHGEAIERGAREEAIAAYRAGELVAVQLEPGPAVTLAQWLAGSGDFAGAANLLRVVTAKEGGEERARAMVVLARLCAERLGAEVEATRLYEEVSRRFPESAAGRFAAEQLSARAGR